MNNPRGCRSSDFSLLMLRCTVQQHFWFLTHINNMVTSSHLVNINNFLVSSLSDFTDMILFILSSKSSTKKTNPHKVIPKDMTEDFVPAAMETIKTVS
jgi:hypothetical protein